MQRWMIALTFGAALVLALMVRGATALVGLAVLFLLFVPLEKLFAFRPQRVFRPHLLTDLFNPLVTSWANHLLLP